MRKMPLLARPILELIEKGEFISHVKALFQKPTDGTAVSAVNGVTLSKTKKSIVVRIKRTDKRLTVDEVAILANEYAIEELTLLELLTKRNIEVINNKNEVINAKPDKPKRNRRKAERSSELNGVSGLQGVSGEAEAHAEDKPKRKRKTSSRNKLLEPGLNFDMSPESPVPTPAEPS